MKTPQKLFDAVYSQELTFEQVKELEQDSANEAKLKHKEVLRLKRKIDKAKQEAKQSFSELSDARLALKFIELGKVPQVGDKMFMIDPEIPEWMNKPCEIIQYEADWHKADVYIPNDGCYTLDLDLLSYEVVG